jgi:hypothetical protein
LEEHDALRAVVELVADETQVPELAFAQQPDDGRRVRLVAGEPVGMVSDDPLDLPFLDQCHQAPELLADERLLCRLRLPQDMLGQDGETVLGSQLLVEAQLVFDGLDLPLLALLRLAGVDGPAHRPGARISARGSCGRAPAERRQEEGRCRSIGETYGWSVRTLTYLPVPRKAAAAGAAQYSAPLLSSHTSAGTPRDQPRPA